MGCGMSDYLVYGVLVLCNKSNLSKKDYSLYATLIYRSGNGTFEAKQEGSGAS